jgi:hypothetical protein
MTRVKADRPDAKVGFAIGSQEFGFGMRPENYVHEEFQSIPEDLKDLFNFNGCSIKIKPYR